MKRQLITFLLLGFSLCAGAQLTPEVTSWTINTTGATGYNSLPSNVQTVQYSTSNVYVSCSCIPGYSIGPWAGNPNIPVNENFVFKITRQPVQNTGTAVAVGLGHIGVWLNGVTIFNPKDANSYNNAGVWHQNALFFEGSSFDACLGHPAPGGEYHLHINPKCLYNDADSTHHSPILGYAFDGFPVYGAYGYTNANGTGAIKRMASSYKITSTTTRTNGPAVSSTYPAGAYCEDYTFTTGYGDLDVHNGRFCVTPEYPNGTYAYFVTLDASLQPVYPFVIGDTYYGTVQTGNTGPTSGHTTITEPTTTYSNTTTGVSGTNTKVLFKLLPNPVTDYAYIYFDAGSANNVCGVMVNAGGQVLKTFQNLQPSIAYSIDCTTFPSGVYYLNLEAGKEQIKQKIVIEH